MDRARAYAAAKGWTISKGHVYIDDGVSGAEFTIKRRGYHALMAALRPRPPIQALIVMDQSRLGRSLDEVPFALKRLADAGVRVFCYLTDQEIRRETATDRFMVSAIAFVDDMHREQARTRTRAAMRRKAERGQVAGGKTYGYRNRAVMRPGPNGQLVREHVLREIEPDQAAVVCRIFTWAAEGWGLSRITRALNAEGIPSPTGRGWGMSGIREMLRRPVYRGQLVYGCTRWQDRDGTKLKVDTPPAEWITREAPELRIVPEPLWQAAHARLAITSALYARQCDGRLIGRPEASLESRYLLSGLMVCGECGRSLIVWRHRNSRGYSRQHYVCGQARTRGPNICPGTLRPRLDSLDAAVLDALEASVLRPEILARVVERAVVRHAEARAAQPNRPAQLERELAGVRAEIGRFVAAIGAGVDLTEIRGALEAAKGRAGTLEAEMAGLAPLPDGRLDRGALEARVGEWRTLLRGAPQRARQILRKLLPDRLRLDRTPEGYRFTGQIAITSLFAGIASPVSVVPPA